MLKYLCAESETSALVVEGVASAGAYARERQGNLVFRLRRLSTEPILCPVPDHPWEAAAVFNCAAIYSNGLFHIWYRATDRPFCLGLERPVEEHKYTSSIGYAISTDGMHFKRFDAPVLVGETSQEMWGVEDPRITFLDGRYYMVYTAFGGRDWFDVRPTIVRSSDLAQWEGRRILLDEPNKDVALFPEKVGGRYAILHRRPPDIWIAFSDDLINWTDHQIVMRPIPGTWQSQKIGIAGPPVRTTQGWLVFYHGVDESRTYRLGAALLDPANPAVVLARQDEPILEPELEWERDGLVPNVVFSCGQAETEDGYLVYYGAADTCIGVAYVSKEDVRF